VNGEIFNSLLGSYKEQVMAMAREEGAITQAFTSYIQAFQTLDPQAAVPYFHVPCMFIPPQGVLVLTTAADVQALLIQVMEGLKARAYARSELLNLRVIQMSDNTALVTVGRVRYATDGRQLERFGETYTLRRIEAGWKIAVAMIHDADIVLH
jgi:ketosteroid isomerase-like protein